MRCYFSYKAKSGRVFKVFESAIAGDDKTTIGATGADPSKYSLTLTCGALNNLADLDTLDDTVWGSGYEISEVILGSKNYANIYAAAHKNQPPNPFAVSVVRPTCECGATKVGSPAHSHWCPIK